MGKWSIILGAWFVTNFWLSMVHAAADNLYISGTLVNEPCTLAEEDRLIEQDFGNIVDKELYINGRTLGLPITLHLQNCDMDVGKQIVNITFIGNESIESKGFLMTSSANVKGLLVGLETKNGTNLPLHKMHHMSVLTAGDNLLRFNAYLQGEPKVLANHTLGRGAFAAALTFALSYE